MNKSIEFRLLIFLWIAAFLLLISGAAPLPSELLQAFAAGADIGMLHPGCLRADDATGDLYLVPGPPGLPCIPTPTPPPGEPVSQDTSSDAQKTGPIRVTVVNNSEESLSLTLNGDRFYIFNLSSGEEKVFVVDRGTYAYGLFHCGQFLMGAMDLLKITTVTYSSCNTGKLVKIYIENNADTDLAIILNGPAVHTFPVSKGQTRFFTILRGDYTYTYFACGQPGAGIFSAKSHRTLRLTCP